MIENLAIRCLHELREFVYRTLCDQNDLECGVFELTERYLTRGGTPCGVFYCLHGPRSVKLTAIWETEHNTIRFYGSTGERLHTTRLQQEVPLVAIA